MIWATTIRRAVWAGPNACILRITVNVITAPIRPPESRYTGDTENSPRTGGLPVKNQITTHATRAVAWTQPEATHTLVCFVTPVLNTPCILINAPERSAVTIPAISCPPVIIDVLPDARKIPRVHHMPLHLYLLHKFYRYVSFYTQLVLSMDNIPEMLYNPERTDHLQKQEKSLIAGGV